MGELLVLFLSSFPAWIGLGGMEALAVGGYAVVGAAAFTSAVTGKGRGGSLRLAFNRSQRESTCVFVG